MPLNPPTNGPLQFAPAAQNDLEGIADFIAQDSPANAVRFISALRVQCQRLAKAPMAYVARPELGEGLRSCAHGRYVIFFRSTAGAVRVERILHSARDLQSEINPDNDENDR